MNVHLKTCGACRGHGCDACNRKGIVVKLVIVQPEPQWSPYRDAYGFGPIRALYGGFGAAAAAAAGGDR